MSSALAAIAVVAMVFASSLPAAADHLDGHHNNGTETEWTDENVTVIAWESVSPTLSSSPGDPCDDWALYSASDGADLPYAADESTGLFVDRHDDGTFSVLYFRYCINEWQYTWVNNLITLEGLALLARDQLVPPLPEPAFAPPAATVRTIVGIDTWFWVPEANWQPITATATAGATSITATATPILLRFDPGDDSPIITCEGPGTAWEEGAESDCWHIYQWVSAHDPNGTWQATVEIEWDIVWEANSGQQGFLDPLFTELELPITVDEVQITVSSPSQRP